MQTTEKRINIYLAISFVTGCFWGGIFVWIRPENAVFVGMSVTIFVYAILSFLGNASDANSRSD